MYTNWNKFHDLLDAKLITQIPLKTKYDIDQAIEHLNKSIEDAIRQSTPAQRTVSKQQDLPDIIKQHIADKRRLRKLWQITRAPQDKTKFNRVIAQLKRILHAHKNDAIQHYLQQLSTTETSDYSLWKATRKIKQQELRNPPIRNNNGQ
jgi:2-phospho-L-lactate guanylyltransferase (CobY/MobA/RfbA family)